MYLTIESVHLSYELNRQTSEFFIIIYAAEFATLLLDVIHNKGASFTLLYMYRGLELKKTTSIAKYIFDSAVAKKRKSAAQNRTRTTNCPNSVSYGAWKIFSPYGCCSACTIRNRFSVFSFSSEDFFTTPPDNMIVTALFQKSKNYVFSFRP